ncbi:MAG: YybH family protein [Acinetobacter sp.]
MMNGPHPALIAANDIVTAFGQHNTAAYFDLFETEAQFVFYTHHEKLDNRAEYENLWTEWETQHGFKVLHCESHNQELKVYGDIALFVHDVHTTVQWDGETNTLEEAETILLKRNDQDQWRAVYEHLSPKMALEQA